MIMPGDFAVIKTTGQMSGLILWGEKIVDRKDGWTHAVICSAVLPDGTVRIVEAQPSGAAETDWHYDDYDHQWSSLTLTSPQRQMLTAAARKYVGTPYSFADYAAIAAHRFVPFVGGPLKDFVADSKHMICSQLVDQCYQDADVHLFNDGRWPGYVTPGDLGGLLAA